jgi:hypothetical protein
MPYKDPEVRKAKHAEYSKRYYEENKVKVIAKNKIRKKARKVDWQAFKATLSCVNCGENHPATFDFHHVERHPDNRKVHKLLQGNNIGGALEEIKKCIVLCANCHRKHHWEEEQENKKKRKKKPRLVSGVLVGA